MGYKSRAGWTVLLTFCKGCGKVVETIEEKKLRLCQKCIEHRRGDNEKSGKKKSNS